MTETHVVIPVSYHREWMDGFGARGWKLDVALDDADVIAVTADTGIRVPTSVLVHDILDHHLCGLPLSGHRNEAKALRQLALRTGMDPMPDLFQIVDEDILHGRANGESLHTLLPKSLEILVPEALDDNAQIIAYLIAGLGKDVLRRELAGHLQAIGMEADTEMKIRYEQTGLDHRCRGSLGMALQHLLRHADALATAEDWDVARGEFRITRAQCAIHVATPRNVDYVSQY